MERPAYIVNIESVEWQDRFKGERFGCRRKALGAAAGREMIGCSFYEIPAGKAPWPYHYHLANEEALYVVEGEGTLRTPEGRFPIGAGDYVALPRGERSGHEVVNTSPAPLRFFSFSTMVEPEVVVYPDSDKLGVTAGSAPGGDMKQRVLGLYLPKGAAVDYWEGEA